MDGRWTLLAFPCDGSKFFSSPIKSPFVPKASKQAIRKVSDRFFGMVRLYNKWPCMLHFSRAQAMTREDLDTPSVLPVFVVASARHWRLHMVSMKFWKHYSIYFPPMAWDTNKWYISHTIPCMAHMYIYIYILFTYIWFDFDGTCR